MHKPLITRTLAANQYLLWSNFAFSCFIHLLILSTSIYSLQVLDRVLTRECVYLTYAISHYASYISGIISHAMGT